MKPRDKIYFVSCLKMDLGFCLYFPKYNFKVTLLILIKNGSSSRALDLLPIVKLAFNMTQFEGSFTKYIV